MKWVTRSHVHVDRVACPWLISRFVDSEAEFLFVPASQVARVAEEQGAIPFDAPGVELGHRDGLCSFETIIAKYGLQDKALLRLAKIVHAADIASELGTDPLAVGLEALAVGYGLRYPDDLENIERQAEVYDALYAWCRLDVVRSGRAN
ncbi:MAG: chromate resistance protein [Chloroflexi bacterium]|nr:chromate resistance protein [Chloroflexota bacterium]